MRTCDAAVIILRARERDDARARFDVTTHRIRRGKVVEIPEKWRGHVPTKTTLRKRRQERELRKRNTLVRDTANIRRSKQVDKRKVRIEYEE